jgi:ornithine cyclodeaminase/alanine dehydrogenase-like protein (mu-crystallin family)
MSPATRHISLRFLNRAQVESLLPDAAELVSIIESGLRAHGAGETVLPPKAHLVLDHLVNGHFNILSGYVGPIGRAGVKVIGDYVDNWRRRLPSEIALLTLYDPETGVPSCLMDATSLTWQRTGAVTCVGARHLARRDARVVTHLGARGTAFQNLKLLAAEFDLEEIRIASRRPETRERLAARVHQELGVACVPVADAATACRDADIIVEATRLERPAVLIPADAVKPGALIVTYGWMMAVDPMLPFRMDKLVVDDWAQCRHGGSLFPLIESGRLTEDHIHGEIGQIVCGAKSGRQRPEERILFWHRGFAISDIVLGHAVQVRAEKEGIGTILPLQEAMEE